MHDRRSTRCGIAARGGRDIAGPAEAHIHISSTLGTVRSAAIRPGEQKKHAARPRFESSGSALTQVSCRQSSKVMRVARSGSVPSRSRRRNSGGGERMQTRGDEIEHAPEFGQRHEEILADAAQHGRCRCSGT